MKTIKKLGWIIPLSLIFLMSTCKDPKPIEPEEDAGNITINFMHQVNGADIIFDSLMYVNEY